jgi:hypothetical protein
VLDVGDVNGQVAAAGITARDLRLIHGAKTRAEATPRLYAWLVHCADSDLPEPHRLARTIDGWREELLAYFDALARVVTRTLTGALLGYPPR